MTFDFMEKIPQIREYLETDIQAAYNGCTAVASKAEIILSYPGLYAISVYRIAHELSLIVVPMIPRIMSEYAHSVRCCDRRKYIYYRIRCERNKSNCKSTGTAIQIIWGDKTS